MAVDERGPIGQPRFFGSGADDQAADLTILGEEIYERGTRLVVSEAQRDQLVTDGIAYDGLAVYNTTAKREEIRESGAWKKAGAGTPWESLRTVLGLPGAWADGSGTPAQIRLNAGNVELRGILENSSAFSMALLGTLPLHYRPGQRITRNTESALQPTIRKALRVEPNGQMLVNSPTSGTAQWWLDGITWSPDT